jgi:formylglycine-generating enzyme required for sulfatase activity
MSTCQSNVPGYSGVYDLSGNLTEWEDSCERHGGGVFCRQRGGPFRYGTSYLSCGSDAYYYSYETRDFVGFRCCSSP